MARRRPLTSLLIALAVCGLLYTVPNNFMRSSSNGNFHTVAETFSYIYQNNIWGNTTSNQPFNSGVGSHVDSIVDPYVAAVRSFIADTFDTAPNAVDLGCGDFNVGRQVRGLVDNYVACDVVPEMIEYNREAYATSDVDFRVLDITSEEPPDGDIVFVRQVLQHLRNDQIANVLPRLRRYRWAIITEHIPSFDPFTPNMDIATGNVRVNFGSGVELAKPPFNFEFYSAETLCEAIAADGRIRTIAYRLTQEDNVGKQNTPETIEISSGLKKTL